MFFFFFLSNHQHSKTDLPDRGFAALPKGEQDITGDHRMELCVYHLYQVLLRLAQQAEG